ncbi:MAG: hypothetical protein COA79_25385 [Planctomycetota bacterium]|nr:MAG: hypothetical protein COA79_25385 [Planctomycetota bacterium]
MATDFNKIPHGKIIFCFIVLLSFTIYSFNRSQKSSLKKLAGITMGVIPYNITLNTNKSNNELKKIHKLIEEFLKSFDFEFSNYKPKSFINRLNKLSVNEKLKSSKRFIFMIKESQRLFEMSKGAFDPTVSPLINLWGFGEKPKKIETITKADVQSVKSKIGFESIKLFDNEIMKEKNISINLSAIAKGYAVDLIAEILDNHDIKDYLVEIGGEVLSKGYKPNGEQFRIGIEIPKNNKDGFYEKFDVIVNLDNKAIATSGNYRNYYEKDGKRYSHIIDPRTGYPADNKIARVTVIADRCAWADGLATTLMVLDIKEGLKLIDSLPGVEALFSIRSEEGKFEMKSTLGFNKFIEKN